MAEQLKSVEVFDAIGWICNNCGRNNFANLIRVEPTTEQREDLEAKIAGSGEEVEMQFYITPPVVVCEWCREKFHPAEPEPVAEE